MNVSPPVLRHYWLEQARAPSGLRHHHHSNRILTPLVIPSGYCAPRVWRVLWSLLLPHKVVICWWRLLKNSVGSQHYFYTLSPVHWPSPICRICRNSVETTHHFFVSCPHKWSFWQVARQQLLLADILDSSDSVWCILVSLQDLNRRPIASDVLVKIWCILHALWLPHWHYIFRNGEWPLTAAIGTLMSDNSLNVALHALEDDD